MSAITPFIYAPARADGQTIRPGSSVSAVIRGTGEIRRVFITGEPDTFFSVPGRASIGGQKVSGFITVATAQGFDTPTADDPAVLWFNPTGGDSRTDATVDRMRRHHANRERADSIARAVILEAGTGIGTPGSRYGETIHACAPVIGAYAVIFEEDSGESLEDEAGGWDFTGALHGIISAVVNDSPEPGAYILERGAIYGFAPADYGLEAADYNLEDYR